MRLLRHPRMEKATVSSSEMELFGGPLRYDSGWSKHEYSRLDLTLWGALKSLPFLIGRTVALAWRTDRRSLITVGVTEVGQGIAAAVKLVAINAVFDGGTLTSDQVKAIRLPHEELSEYAFLETRDAVQRLRPVDGQIMLAAYRARLGNTATAHLADGRHLFDVPALDRHDVHVRYRPLWDSPFNRAPVPERLAVQQAWAWCFVPDGRVVLVADPGPRGALPMLPGGTVEMTVRSPEVSLHREAAEEAQHTLNDPVRLGWVLDEAGEVFGGVGPSARLRLAARVTGIGPAAVDLATGRPFARLLATPAQAAALLGWGSPGARQAQLAAETAQERWALPVARPAAIEEFRAEGMRLS
ncbi:NUDIX hydrolase [Streptomyces sp. NBC_01465]|uniref:NUDIX hydrolase n=1 Tax=Streptomyces sp. NBC_01465 TaxID=2903878 RepID=UPI002E3233E4|nr:NUDIX hydrolase [Streptomyces sp. NBC_01465]